MVSCIHNGAARYPATCFLFCLVHAVKGARPACAVLEKVLRYLLGCGQEP